MDELLGTSEGLTLPTPDLDQQEGNTGDDERYMAYMGDGLYASDFLDMEDFEEDLFE